METRNYAQAVYCTFEKLNVLWKRFSIFKKQNPYSNKSNYSYVADRLKIISSIFILGLFIYVIIMRKKEEPNFDNSNKKRKKN